MRKTKRIKSLKKSRFGYFFIAPYFIVFLIFGLYPIIYSFYTSFSKWDGFSPPVFIGLDNYQRLFTNLEFYHSILNTLIIWIVSIVPELIIALLLALILNERFVKGKHVFRAVFYFPNIVTAITIGVLVNLMFDWQTGSINKLLMALHITDHPINWFGHSFLAQIIISAVMCWQWFGVNMLIFTAGLQSIPRTLYEAAEVDGANRFQITMNITLPLLKPVILFTVITSIIGGMQIFEVPLVAGNASGDSTQTMMVYLYNTAFTRFQYGYASSISYGMFIIILIFSIISLLVSRSRKKNTQSV
ncbi:multiple sugar transport system permease protein [Pullulanibacillus pueri]|uniref:Sugar ABC transporter ATP-binding protein n=1 Tax=Pullulanibacillus pueri TaxID=1437324 RepID=A0A8J2ZQM7_9BACL|nr:sugar ABC transporter permease [Pullulanibacillus pueri]MBM7679895.1 multiple sugar transport system permease protein [Pullulanibacillus pueri]GGH73366.1 sugar ABC transporter ATP-binding protein [Pullulanibacillus pueri]